LVLLLSSGLTRNVADAQGARKKALLLLPIESYTDNEFPYLQSYLHDKAHYDIVVKRDAEVDLETIKHLSDYDVVFINSHGNVENNKFVFASGVPDGANVFDKNSSDFKDRLLTHYSFFSGLIPVIPRFRIGVTSSYLAKYNNFHGTLIYACCCFSQTGGVLARAVMGKGARGVIGFERAAVMGRGDDSGTQNDDREAKKFFEKATDPGVSVDTAYNDVYRSTPGMVGEGLGAHEVAPPCHGWVLKANKGESLFLAGEAGKLPEIPDVGGKLRDVFTGAWVGGEDGMSITSMNNGEVKFLENNTGEFAIPIGKYEVINDNRINILCFDFEKPVTTIVNIMNSNHFVIQPPNCLVDTPIDIYRVDPSAVVIGKYDLPYEAVPGGGDWMEFKSDGTCYWHEGSRYGYYYVEGSKVYISWYSNESFLNQELTIKGNTLIDPERGTWTKR